MEYIEVSKSSKQRKMKLIHLVLSSLKINLLKKIIYFIESHVYMERKLVSLAKIKKFINNNKGFLLIRK